MPDLHYWQEKIKERRKTTSWKDFLLTIGSWRPMAFYKNNGYISIYPTSPRSPEVKSNETYDESIVWLYQDYSNGNIFNDISILLWKVWLANVAQVNNENSNFSDTTINSKNIYLSTVIINNCENVAYGVSVKDNSTNVFDSMMVWDHSENIYKSQSVIKSFNIFYSITIVNSNNIRFSRNLVGCTECMYCNDLDNQSYCIYNKVYPKEEYLILKKKILQEKEKFSLTDGVGKNIACWNTKWSANIECTDCDNVYYSYNVKDGKNLYLHGSSKGSEHAYDCFTWGSPYAEHMYGVMWAGAAENIYCSIFVNGWSNNIYYSINCDACSFCLGCIGLKNKQFCILNKQYTKEERHIKVDEIFAQMEKDWTLGAFFPWSMNPFYFNDTAAYLIDQSFTKEEVTKLWYLWRDEAIKVDIPAGAEVVKVSELGNFEGFVIAREWNDRGNPGGIQWIASSSLHSSSQWRDELSRHIDPSILNKIIVDEQGNYYRIVKMEYDFLVKHWLPLPRKHRLDRMKENFRLG